MSTYETCLEVVRYLTNRQVKCQIIFQKVREIIERIFLENIFVFRQRLNSGVLQGVLYRQFQQKIT